MPEVLACIDFSDATPAVMAQAAALARCSGERLHLVHVAAEEPIIAGYDRDPVGAYTRDDRAGELREEHHQMRELAASIDDGIEVVPLLLMGDTVEKILEEAQRIGAAYIVVGSHGHGGLHHLLLGSVSESLLRASTVPVVVVPVRA